MPTVYIPSLLRSLTGGVEKIEVTGETVGEVIDDLEKRHPGVKQRLCDGSELRPGLAVSINTEMAKFGLNEPVNETSEVHFLPAIGGG